MGDESVVAFGGAILRQWRAELERAEAALAAGREAEALDALDRLLGWSAADPIEQRLAVLHQHLQSRTSALVRSAMFLRSKCVITALVRARSNGSPSAAARDALDNTRLVTELWANDPDMLVQAAYPFLLTGRVDEGSALAFRALSIDVGHADAQAFLQRAAQARQAPSPAAAPRVAPPVAAPATYASPSPAPTRRPLTCRFNALDTWSQQHFVAITHRKSQPQPILREASPRLGAARRIIVAVVASSAVLYASLSWGFGNAYSSLSRHGVVGTAFCAAGIYLLVSAIVALARAYSVEGSAPYVPGRYLFADYYVDARTPEVVLIPTSSIALVSVQRLVFPRVLLAFENGTRVRFWLAWAVSFVDVEAALAEGSAKAEFLTRAAAENERPALTARAPTPIWRFAWLATLPMAVACAVLVMQARNTASDHAMFASAVQWGTSDAMQQYLDGDGRVHRAEAEALRAKALLREGMKGKDLWDQRRFLAKHPELASMPEVNQYMLDTYRAELAQAKTLGALRKFRVDNPKSPVDAEALAAIVALRKQAVAKLRADTSSVLMPLLAAALTANEATDGDACVRIEVVGPTQEFLDGLNAELAQDKAASGGKVSLIEAGSVRGTIAQHARDAVELALHERSKSVDGTLFRFSGACPSSAPTVTVELAGVERSTRRWVENGSNVPTVAAAIMVVDVSVTTSSGGPVQRSAVTRVRPSPPTDVAMSAYAAASRKVDDLASDVAKAVRAAL